MPQKSWAVGEEVLAADFNLYAQNQVVPQFTNATQRDAQWAAAPAGALCVTADNGRLYQRIGGMWWTPFARVGFASRATNYGTNNTEGVALQVTISNVPTGRILRIEAGWWNFGGSPGEGVITRLRDGSLTTSPLLAGQAVNMGAPGTPQASTGPGGGITATHQPSVGAHTYSLTVQSTTANTATMQQAPGSPIWIEVVDQGAF